MTHALEMSYDEAVQTLARWHRESDEPPDRIIHFPDPQHQVVRLLEVTDLTPETGEVYALQFGRTRDLPYVTVVAQITPAEWERIRAGAISLPEGWDLNRSEEV